MFFSCNTALKPIFFPLSGETSFVLRKCSHKDCVLEGNRRWFLAIYNFQDIEITVILISLLCEAGW